jgi:hypothetical protein
MLHLAHSVIVIHTGTAQNNGQHIPQGPWPKQADQNSPNLLSCLDVYGARQEELTKARVAW